MAIAEWIALVDQQKIEPTLKRKILEAIVENESIASKLLDGIGSAFNTVLVHQDYYPGQITG